VCLQPFALNEATQFISPTKTLEYMAAGKPVVSTAIRDVAGPYGHVVEIARGAQEFVAACERALQESPESAAKRRTAMHAVVTGTSWDATVDAMRGLVDEAALVRSRPVRLPVPSTGPTPAGRPQHRVARLRRRLAPSCSAPDRPVSAPVTTSGRTVLILEQHAQVGGWCRSIEEGGFTFDYAGHIMFSN
jgi:hypothetical protein